MKNNKAETVSSSSNVTPTPGEKKLFIVLVFIALAGLVGVYWNHFDNSFHFDDSHTIENNMYIRDVKANVGKYFSDAKTITPLPANQSYRPLITLSYGVDYWISYRLGHSIGDKMEALEKENKINTPEYQKLVKEAQESRYVTRKNEAPKPFIFHCSNFFWYIIQGILVFLFIFKLFNIFAPHRYNRFFALFAAAWYMFHTANAETINYICARTDSYSTMFVMLAFVIYQYWGAGRKYYLYLIPMVLGILTKPSALMFAPLLMVYIFLVEQQLSLTNILKASTWKTLFKLPVLLGLTIPMAVALVGYYIVEKKTPETFVATIGAKYNYFITQPYVWLQYFQTFFYPNHLSADTDLYVFANIKDTRFWPGVFFVILLFASAIYTSSKKELRPISFGLFWFIVALLPPTLKPLSEALNDHRIFFPFIGLAISCAWVFVLIYRKYEGKASFGTVRTALTALALLIVVGHAYGTVQRNKVWKTEESLWYDVTVKSPKNGRGLMNYGLSQYHKGLEESGKGNKQKAIDLVNRALEYYQKALKLNPNYTYLLVNTAIAYDQLDMLQNSQQYQGIVESYFKAGQTNAMGYYGGYSYYAAWLWKKGRRLEAIPLAETALKLGPDYQSLYTDLMGYYLQEYQWDNLKATANLMLQRFPGNQFAIYYLNAAENRRTQEQELKELIAQSPIETNYVKLYLYYYNRGMFAECISLSDEIIAKFPKSADAYYNKGTAYIQNGDYTQAIPSLEKALSINPKYTAAQQNIAWAKQQIARPTPDTFINTGLGLQNKGLYDKAIEFYLKALAVDPNNGLANNNICSAYNAKGQYAQAIAYGEKAVKLDPTNQLFKNNLKIAQNQGK